MWLWIKDSPFDLTPAILTFEIKRVPVLHSCMTPWFPSAQVVRVQSFLDFSFLRVSLMIYTFYYFVVFVTPFKNSQGENTYPESMTLQYFSILPSSSRREYGLANKCGFQHHAANMIDVAGGSAYDNREVNEKSQAGSCFVRLKIKLSICQ